MNRAAAGRVIVDKKRTNKQNKTNKQTYSKTYTSLFALTSELRVKSKNHICIHNNNNAKPCTKSIRFDKYSIILWWFPSQYARSLIRGLYIEVYSCCIFVPRGNFLNDVVGVELSDRLLHDTLLMSQLWGNYFELLRDFGDWFTEPFAYPDIPWTYFRRIYSSGHFPGQYFSSVLTWCGTFPLHHYHPLIYRVAQIKISHRTKCNFSTTVWNFYIQISWFIWERSCYNSDYFYNYFSFLQSYGYINILCHIFNSAQNNQQQLVIFIHVMVSAGVCFGGKEKLHFIPDTKQVYFSTFIV